MVLPTRLLRILSIDGTVLHDQFVQPLQHELVAGPSGRSGDISPVLVSISRRRHTDLLLLPTSRSSEYHMDLINLLDDVFAGRNLLHRPTRRRPA